MKSPFRIITIPEGHECLYQISWQSVQYLLRYFTRTQEQRSTSWLWIEYSIGKDEGSVATFYQQRRINVPLTQRTESQNHVSKTRYYSITFNSKSE